MVGIAEQFSGVFDRYYSKVAYTAVIVSVDCIKRLFAVRVSQAPVVTHNVHIYVIASNKIKFIIPTRNQFRPKSLTKYRLHTSNDRISIL